MSHNLLETLFFLNATTHFEFEHGNFNILNLNILKFEHFEFEHGLDIELRPKALVLAMRPHGVSSPAGIEV